MYDSINDFLNQAKRRNNATIQSHCEIGMVAFVNKARQMKAEKEMYSQQNTKTSDTHSKIIWLTPNIGRQMHAPVVRQT